MQEKKRSKLKDTQVCPECKGKGHYQVENVYTGPFDTPCEFCEKGHELAILMFPKNEKETYNN